MTTELGVIKPCRDELRNTITVKRALGCGFSFAESQKIDRKNAEALWTGCTFNITR
jgi:hypothetical protein